jgi:hypothetical protein
MRMMMRRRLRVIRRRRTLLARVRLPSPLSVLKPSAN